MRLPSPYTCSAAEHFPLARCHPCAWRHYAGETKAQRKGNNLHNRLVLQLQVCVSASLILRQPLLASAPRPCVLWDSLVWMTFNLFLSRMNNAAAPDKGVLAYSLLLLIHPAVHYPLLTCIIQWQEKVFTPLSHRLFIHMSHQILSDLKLLLHLFMWKSNCPRIRAYAENEWIPRLPSRVCSHIGFLSKSD